MNRWKTWNPPAWVIAAGVSWLFYLAALIVLVLSLGVPYINQKTPW